MQSCAGLETAGLRFESAVRFVIYEVNVCTLRLDYVHASKAYRYVRYSNHCHLYRISPQGDVRARHSGYTLLCSVTMCPTATHRVGLQKCDPHLTMNIDWPGHWPSCHDCYSCPFSLLSRHQDVWGCEGTGSSHATAPKTDPPSPNDNINDTSEFVASPIRLRVTPASKLGSQTKQPRVFDIFPSRSMKMPEDYLKLRHDWLLPIIIHNSVVILMQ